MRFDRYTVNDVILAPLSEGSEKALGREVYYSSNTVAVVDVANYGLASCRSKLIGVAPGMKKPFYLDNGETAYCIIVAKYDDNNTSVHSEDEEDEYEELEDEYDCKCNCDESCDGDCSCHCCREENTSEVAEGMTTLTDTGYEPFSFAADFTNAYYLESKKIPESDLHNRFLVNQGIWLYYPAEGIDVCVTAIAINGVYVAASQGVQFLDWEKLFRTCRFMNDSPCGVKRVF